MLASLKGARAVVLVDGNCALCHGFTKFVAGRDSGDKVRFATQQSDVGRALLKSHNQPIDLSTIVVIELSDGGSEQEQAQSECFTKSTAVLRTMRHLGGLWWLLAAFLIIPTFVRDFCYDLVARNRIRIFGATRACGLPDIKTKKKVIDVVERGQAGGYGSSPLREIGGEDEFNQCVRDDRVTLVYFSASWCQPCKKVTPIVTRWSEEKSLGFARFIKVDADKHRPLAKKCKIKQMPQFLIFQGGAIKSRHVGSSDGNLETVRTELEKYNPLE